MSWDKNWAFLNDPFKYRWLMFCVLGVCYFLVCLHRISTTVIARDLVLEFNATATALGMMSSSYFYLYAAVQPPVGLLSDTVGPRRVTTFFTFIAFAGALIFGIASNMTMATVGRALIGIGVGGVFIPGLKAFSNWYRQREFAGITGIFLAIGNAGNLSASLPLTFLVLLLGWRMTFLSLGTLSFLLAMMCWLVVRDRPEDKGWQPVEVKENPLPPASEDIPRDMSYKRRLKIVISQPSFWMVTISIFFFGGPSLTFQGLWAVPYLMDVYGYSRMQAGGLLMIIPLGFVIGAPTFGFLADRVALSRKAILLCSLGPSLICWPIFFLSKGSLNDVSIALLFLIMGSCGGGSLSLYMTMMKEHFPPWLTGTAVGLMNSAGFLSTAVFQPFTGYLMDAVGKSGPTYPVAAYNHVIIVFFISFLTAFIAITPLSIRKTGYP